MNTTQTAFRLSELYVSIGNAAKLLSVNRLTIRRWINQGKLQAEAIGRTTIVSKEELKRIAQERKIILS